MKKLISIVIILAIMILAACGNSKASEKVVKVGLPSSELKIWEFVKKEAEKQGIDIKLEVLSSSVDPNQVLEDGDIDLNAFQHLAYLDLFNQKNDSDIQAIGTTIICPLGMYSKKYSTLTDLKDGAKIAVPNDPSNWGRALMLLQKNGLLTLKDSFDGNGGKDSIATNPKNLEILPADAATIPRVLDDVDFGIINNGYAYEAGYLLKDAIIAEDKTAKPYINIIAANKKDVKNKTYQKIVEIYQSDAVAKHIEDVYQGNYLPVKSSLSEIADWKDSYKQ